MTHRQLKKQAIELLSSEELEPALAALCDIPARQIVNPLFGLLYHNEALIRWRAVSAMGAVVSNLADNEMESARIIMRRFMWNLNDESGGIGWGSPESMGEIMARHRQLAEEFGCLLISYADPDGNYLEHPTLQQGVLWGWGRLGRRRPEMLQSCAALLIPYMSSEDAYLQGLAAWAAEPLAHVVLEGPLKALTTKRAELVLYEDHALNTQTIGRLAKNALAAMGEK